jgi:hypothetical protein
MSGFVVRDESHAVIGVMAGIYAVWNPDQREERGQCGRDVRASLAESMEHRITTVPIALEGCQVPLLHAWLTLSEVFRRYSDYHDCCADAKSTSVRVVSHPMAGLIP